MIICQIVRVSWWVGVDIASRREGWEDQETEASSTAAWIWSYRRFNHRFHLDNLPLRDMKVGLHIYIYIFIHIYIHIYIYVWTPPPMIQRSPENIASTGKKMHDRILGTPQFRIGFH